MKRFCSGAQRPDRNRNFDIMPDGEQFVVVVRVADDETENEQVPAGQINVVLNWFEELKERVAELSDDASSSDAPSPPCRRRE